MKNILKSYTSAKSIIDDTVIKCDEIIDTPDIHVIIIANSHCQLQLRKTSVEIKNMILVMLKLQDIKN